MRTTTTNILRKEFSSNLSPIYQLREADQIASIVIEHLFGIQGTSQLLHQKMTIPTAQELTVDNIFGRLLKHEPIQYVLGYTEFYGRQFKTDARALIPRPETEELVDFILNEAVSNASRIMDIGTGSGCIAITTNLETDCKVFAIDVDMDALALARENAVSLSAVVNFIQVDILNTKPDLPQLDIIVSNPPYVPKSDHAFMDSKVKDFEPLQALFVPEQDPVIFYQRIANLAPEYLVPGGQVFLEIYHLAGLAVKSLFQGPQWSQVSIKKDLQGKDRMVKAILK
jgi:release factor glutamine methyltransferase